MTTRFTTAACALALSLAASGAFAQAGNWPGRAPAAPAYDPAATGSIAPRDPRVPAPGAAWEIDSAKAGNANQLTRPVPQFGQTSGGPGY